MLSVWSFLIHHFLNVRLFPVPTLGKTLEQKKTNEVKIILFFHGPREVLPMGCEQSFTVIGRWREGIETNWGYRSEKFLFSILDLLSYLLGRYLISSSLMYFSMWAPVISAWPEFEFWLCQLLAMWPGVRFSTTPNLGFFMCKLEMLIEPIFRGRWED